MPLYLVATEEGQDVYSWASAMPDIQVDWGVKGHSGLEGVWSGAEMEIDLSMLEWVFLGQRGFLSRLV